MIDLNKFSEVISTMEVKLTSGATMRIDHKQRKTFFVPYSEENEFAGLVDESAELSAAFETDVLALELAAGLMRQWKEESNTEEANKPLAVNGQHPTWPSGHIEDSFTPPGTNEDGPEIFGTTAERRQIEQTHGPMVMVNGKAAEASLQGFALR